MVKRRGEKTSGERRRKESVKVDGRKEQSRLMNYIKLHRNSDHTDQRVQTRWCVLNLYIIITKHNQSKIVRRKRVKQPALHRVI